MHKTARTDIRLLQDPYFPKGVRRRLYHEILPNAPGAFTYQYKDSDLRGNDGAEPAVSQHLPV